MNKVYNQNRKQSQALKSCVIINQVSPKSIGSKTLAVSDTWTNWTNSLRSHMIDFICLYQYEQIPDNRGNEWYLQAWRFTDLLYSCQILGKANLRVDLWWLVSKVEMMELKDNLHPQDRICLLYCWVTLDLHIFISLLSGWEALTG